MNNFILLKCGVSGTKTILNTLTNGETAKQILDPLSCIIRLALLNFKEKGTKISISNNRIYYQLPTIFQGPMRWTYGDNRNDLHQLCNPIEKAIQWFDPKKNDDVRDIFKYAVKGLIRLKDSYVKPDFNSGDSNLVCHSIAHYISIISQKLNGQFAEDNDMDGNNNPRYLWNKIEIMIINNLIKLAIEKIEKNDHYNYAIHAIENILEGKDECMKKLITKPSTSL